MDHSYHQKQNILKGDVSTLIHQMELTVCDISMILTLKYDGQLSVGDITWSTDYLYNDVIHIGYASCDKLCNTCIVVSIQCFL